MADTPREIPHIRDIMKLRMTMKADKSFAAEIKQAIYEVCQSRQLGIQKGAVDATILVHPEEVATTEAVGSLPVGAQCQAW